MSVKDEECEKNDYVLLERRELLRISANRQNKAPKTTLSLDDKSQKRNPHRRLMGLANHHLLKTFSAKPGNLEKETLLPSRRIEPLKSPKTWFWFERIKRTLVSLWRL